MKPQSPSQVSTTLYDQDRVMQQVYKILSGNVSFGSLVQTPTLAKPGFRDNTDGVLVKGTSAVAAGTDIAVTHNLGRVPIGFIIVNKTATADYWTSTTAWTVSQIFLKCSINTPTFTVYIF